MLERTEHLKITLVISKENLNKELIDKIYKFTNIILNAGDTVTYSQEFDIEYYNVIWGLDLILDLAEKASIIDVNTEELEYGVCKIQEVLCKLDKIEKKINK